MVKSSGFRLPSFSGWVGIVWAVLQIKESHEYSQVVLEEEETFVGESRSYNDSEEDIGLLNPENASNRRKPKRPKRSGCCVCCGLNCSLFWKAFAIVLAVTGAWYAVELIKWAVTPAPTGLEHMPVYSTSLGCLSAPYVYNGGKTSVSIPAGSRYDHAIDVHGGSPGTIFIAEGSVDATEIQYDILIRSNDESLLSQISLIYPMESEVENSRFLLSTPLAAEDKCLRFDIVMRIPPTLKKLHVASHTAAHVQFDPKSKFSMDDLFVTLYYSTTDNMILPHENVHATHMSLEVYRGWIVGDVSIVSSTSS
ncbi:hypothetical protein CPB85DRAFT_1429443 [Mucidula mucida]|nr:hypothetical protein CPB85DRAFT_1429443 [Mucidula mucida]